MSLLSSYLFRTKIPFKSYNISSRFEKCQIKRLSDTAKKEDATNQASKGTSSGVKLQFEPSNFQKRILVWTKMYKNTSEIPSRVSRDLLDRANNKARIKTANYMIVVVLLLCFLNAYQGRKAQQRGETLHKKNIDWHKELNETAKEEK